MRKRKSYGHPNLNVEERLSSLIDILIPSSYTESFNFVRVKKSSESIELILEEKESLIPDELKETSNVVLDGFCDSISILSQTLLDKKLYLEVKRRRWKKSNTDEHYSNNYTLHPQGLKITKELGVFLKERD